jgi:hypothetical protein
MEMKITAMIRIDFNFILSKISVLLTNLVCALWCAGTLVPLASDQFPFDFPKATHPALSIP